MDYREPLEDGEFDLIAKPDDVVIDPSGVSFAKRDTLTPVKKGDNVYDTFSRREGKVVDITEGKPEYGILIVVDYPEPAKYTPIGLDGKPGQEVITDTAGIHFLNEGEWKRKMVKIKPEPTATTPKTKKPKAAEPAKLERRGDSIKVFDGEMNHLQVAIRRVGIDWSSPPGGLLDGYVGVPPEHPWYGKLYTDCLEREDNGECIRTPEDQIDVHGGITYSDKGDGEYLPNDNTWWFGFDCAHRGDTNKTCSEEYVKEELDSLSKQLGNVVEHKPFKP